LNGKFIMYKYAIKRNVMREKLFFLFFLLTTFYTLSSDPYKADVIIYGGTSAAVISAVEITQSGKKCNHCITQIYTWVVYRQEDWVLPILETKQLLVVWHVSFIIVYGFTTLIL